MVVGWLGGGPATRTTSRRFRPGQMGVFWQLIKRALKTRKPLEKGTKSNQSVEAVKMPSSAGALARKGLRLRVGRRPAGEWG